MVEEYKKPLPEMDEELQSFWDACKTHELRVQQCHTCGTCYYPSSICSNCDDPKMEWVKVSGKGKLHTYTIFHQLYHPAFKDDIPYNAAIIELDEGPLLLSNVVQCKNEDLKLGMPLEVTFEDVTEDVTLPKFKPV